jgi:hypothetical protein
MAARTVSTLIMYSKTLVTIKKAKMRPLIMAIG